MQATAGRTPARGGWLLLAGAAAIGAALAAMAPRGSSAHTVADMSGEHTAAPIPDGRDFAPSLESGSGETGGGADGVKPKRGITPPWREHAIPELRSQPGKRHKKFNA